MVSLKRAVLAGQGCVKGETDKQQSHVSAHPGDAIMHFLSWERHDPCMIWLISVKSLCECGWSFNLTIKHPSDLLSSWPWFVLPLLDQVEISRGELWWQVRGWVGNRGRTARKHTLQGSQTSAASVWDHSHSSKLRTSWRARTEHVSSCRKILTLGI